MSNKSGVAEQVISVPQGGGALTGVGETFSPDLHTGTGNFTVPIDLPNGRNGFQPEVALTYSTGNGNGPFGLGWALSVPGVGRKTSDGVPVYDDAADTFVLSGAEDLVPVGEHPAGGDERRIRYRPRTESLFARIDRHRSPTTDHWTVRSKDGLESTYGTPGARGADPATVAAPPGREKVFEWRLTGTTDPFGNHIAYEYHHDPADEEQRDDGRSDTPEDARGQWDQTYLRSIRYVDVDRDGGTEYLVSATFEYGDRPDPFSGHRAGFEVRTRRRCSRIVVRTHVDGDGAYTDEGRVVRSYELEYLDERAEAGDVDGRSLPPNGVSVLSRVRVVGRDGAETQELPPLEFGYTEFDPDGRDFFPVEGAPPRSLSDPDLELADLFGNGLPDVVQTGETVRYWRNRGGGAFDDPRTMRESPAGVRLADRGTQLIDADGDGRIDLLATIDGLSGYFPLGRDGEWDRRSFRAHAMAPSFDLEGPEVRLVDLDGDGVTDAVRSGSRFECFFNDPEEGWHRTRRVPRRGLDAFPNVSFADERVRWGDASGDGLQDVLLIHDGSVEYWPGLGHGDWGGRVRMRNSPRFPGGYDPERLLVGDIDGDGLADLVYVDDGRVRLWINRSGNGWSDPVEIEGTPSVTDADAVRLVDLLGRGVKGLLWSRDDRGVGDHAFFLDFTGGTKPYLLDEVDNHRGAITRVAYAPSTAYYLEDERRAETRWGTSLPFPVQVVARVETIDAISEGKLTTEYRYRHGYWDGADREFRGFGAVEQFDSETFEEYNGAGLHGDDGRFADVGTADDGQFSPPTVTKTWFHQGAIGAGRGDWREPDYGREYWPGDSQTLSRPEEMRETLARLSRRDRRDALRTLRGRVLRTELYAADGSEREDRPYTVTERLHGVREEEGEIGEGEEDRPDDGDGDRRRIFFPHSLASRTTRWERGDDPMTQYSFTGGYDEYGQSRHSIELAEPRTPASRGPDEPDAVLGTYALTEFAGATDELYAVDRAVRRTTYELSDDDGDVFEIRDALAGELDAALADGSVPAGDLVGQTVTFYDGAAFTGLPFGELGAFGAAVRTETLVLTDDVLAEAYPAGDEVLGGEALPYFAPDGAPAWPDGGEHPDPYPEAFKARYEQRTDETRAGGALPPAERLTVTPLGYGFSAGESEAPFVRGYYVATDRRAYDVQRPDGGSRGLVCETLGPLGGEREGTVEGWTRVEYDAFDFLPVALVSPAGLTTRVEEYDYRTFKPSTIVDANENRTAFGYTPLGLLRYTAVVGQEGVDAGDTRAQPGTVYQYDFGAFDASPPDDRQPISVRTARRERHQQPALSPQELEDLTFEEEIEGHPEHFVQTREYSDGFGRLVQTRTQAEDVVFGDSTFGGQDLFVDQVVVVRDAEGFDPLEPEDLSGHAVGVREGATSEWVAEAHLVASGVLTDADRRRYPNYSAAIDALVAEDVDAVVLDEAIASGFANERPVRAAFSITPEEAVGEVVPDGEGPRAVVSGWQTYDNKGRVVERYEPFYATGWEYLSRGDAEAGEPGVFGRKATTYRDPRGRVVRTVTPDGSERRVLFGTLEEERLDAPDESTPTPWESVTYDANDNAGRTHGADPDRAVDAHLRPPEEYAHHWDTPASGVVDALGRVVEAVERNRTAGGPVEHLRTRTGYDVRGNVLTVTDPLGREAFSYAHDLADTPLRVENVDAGVRVTVLDAAGNEVERRDSRAIVPDGPGESGANALVLRAFDESNRPIRLWARDGGAGTDEADPPTLREFLVYGDGPDAGFRTPDGEFSEDAKERNLLGALVRQYDEAGLLTVESYDFRGNLLEKERRVVSDAAIPDELPIDWQPPGTTPGDREAALLDGTGYVTSFAYDALDRVVSVQYPEDVDGDRRELRFAYNRAGALQHADLVGDPGTADESVETYVEHVAYDAKGQRTLVALGNGVMTRYAYDPRTFRLSRLRSERYTSPDPGETPHAHAYVPEGAPLQDVGYEYDLAGNVTTLRDRTPDSGILDSPLGRHALDREFTYDATYRLESATGRECGSSVDRQPWEGSPRCTELSGTRAYSEEYAYDRVGGLTRLEHLGTQQRNGGTGFVREFLTEDASNRLEAAVLGGAEQSYRYDGAGNLLRETAHRQFTWDHGNRMTSFRTQSDAGEASVRARYLYDSSGQRVKKLVRKQGGVEATVYLDGLFEHHRWQRNGEEPGENNRLHVMDDRQRVAMIRAGDRHPTDQGPAVQYHLGDHLGSSSLVVDDAATFVKREEYTPYGETSFGSFGRKRYRYGGTERDEESGLYYHGARYYAVGLAHWTSVDPEYASYPQWSPFSFSFDNPLRFRDRDGRAPDDIANQVKEFEEAVGEFEEGLEFLDEQLDEYENMSPDNLAKLDEELELFDNLEKWAEGARETGDELIKEGTSLGKAIKEDPYRGTLRNRVGRQISSVKKGRGRLKEAGQRLGRLRFRLPRGGGGGGGSRRGGGSSGPVQRKKGGGFRAAGRTLGRVFKVVSVIEGGIVAGKIGKHLVSGDVGAAWGEAKSFAYDQTIGTVKDVYHLGKGAMDWITGSDSDPEPQKPKRNRVAEGLVGLVYVSQIIGPALEAAAESGTAPRSPRGGGQVDVLMGSPRLVPVPIGPGILMTEEDYWMMWQLGEF